MDFSVFSLSIVAIWIRHKSEMLLRASLAGNRAIPLDYSLLIDSYFVLLTFFYEVTRVKPWVTFDNNLVCFKCLMIHTWNVTGFLVIFLFVEVRRQRTGCHSVRFDKVETCLFSTATLWLEWVCVIQLRMD